MKPKPDRNSNTLIMPPKPTPRILITRSGRRKWKGCIYISSHDLTGQILMLLRDVKRESSGLFLKNPAFVFISRNKHEVESKISEKIQSLIKKSNIS